MDKTIQANASSSEETASSAEEMNSQAQVLHEQVIALTNLVNGNTDKASTKHQQKQENVEHGFLNTNPQLKILTNEQGEDPLKNMAKVNNSSVSTTLLKKVADSRELANDNNKKGQDKAWKIL